MKTFKGLDWYIEQGGDPIDALMNYQYKERIGETLCLAIKLEFPKIPNLSYDVDREVITFDEGIYTKEEVENFINQFRKANHSGEASS